MSYFMTTMQRFSSLILILALGLNNAWAEEGGVAVDEAPGDTTPVSHIDGWEEESSPEDTWTWFGMGYESRNSGMEMTQGVAGSAASTAIRSGGGGRK
jgi:hypothetical protein